jgi:hypothetical protein
MRAIVVTVVYQEGCVASEKDQIMLQQCPSFEGNQSEISKHTQ